MPEWLALHGLDADACRERLVQGASSEPQTAPDPAFPVAEVLPEVLAALGRALPAAAVILDRVRAELRIDLAPDLNRFPRAFTLHDDGRGVPFVSCPLKGRCSDLLLLAHEVGHACQLLANGTPHLPPVLRETAAYLAEELVWANADSAEHGVLRALHRARTVRMMARDGRALLDALDAPKAAYRYDWNYPIARDLAERAAVHLTQMAQWQVFTGQICLPQLLKLPKV